MRKQVSQCFVMFFFMYLPVTSALAGEPVAEHQDHILDAAVFLSEPTLLPVDRALFKQLSVAENADLLPDAPARHAAQNKRQAELTHGFVLALQQQQAEKEQLWQDMRREQVRRDKMQSLRGSRCDQPWVNYSECRAAVDRKIAAGAFPPLSQVLAEGEESALRVNLWGPGY